MKISLFHHENRLCELYFGDTFEIFGEFYMLVNTCGRMSEVTNSSEFCCVRLTDGECVLFKSGDIVHPINAELYLRD